MLSPGSGPIEGRNLQEANVLLRVAIGMWREDTGRLTDELENLLQACEKSEGSGLDGRACELVGAIVAAREVVRLSRDCLQHSQHL